MYGRWRDERRELAILCAAFAIFLIYAYPGYTSPDSVQQLAQARSHVYADGHPPVMAALWSLTDHVIAGPLGMLLIQGLALLVGLYVLLRRHVRPLAAAICASAVFLAPPVIVVTAVIWKDSQMAAFFVLGTALIADRRVAVRWCGFAAITLAIAMRYNACVAAPPLFLFMWSSPPGRRTLARIALAVALWVGSTGIAMAANRALTTVHERPWSYSVGPADIVGILANTKRAYSDAELEQILAGTPLVVHAHIQAEAKLGYNPTLWWWVINGKYRVFTWPANDAQCAAVARAWRTLVRAELGPYVHHRSRVFRAMLQTGTIYNELVTNPVVHTHLRETGTEPAWGPPQVWLQDALDWLVETTPIFRPYIYLLVALLFIPIAIRQRAALALLLSGILYEVTFLPFSPSAEYRYSHWMITCTLVAIVLLVRARAAQRVLTRTSGRPSK
ncbi:MAG TPA: hypothetical protein VIV58_08070 [Kofleriaceae bacterium]